MSMSVSDLRPVPTKPVQSRWRRIVTAIPAPDSVPIIERLRALEPRSMSGMPPILWHEAQGFLVRDPYGNQWIDLTSAIMLANAGHAHPKILRAIGQAADQKLLASYIFPTEVRQKLTEKLLSLAPLLDAKAILFSSGTEANECAMSLMRQHGQNISSKKVGILSFEGCFHGRTLGAALAGGSPQPSDSVNCQQFCHYQIPFPFSPNCIWNHPDQLCDGSCFRKSVDLLTQRGIGPDQIAGIIAEPLPGWATWPIPPGFARDLADWAKQNDILITFDEVQTGSGRTGKFFGFEHTGITPDLIVMGKGLSSSLPVSAVIGPKQLMDEPVPGQMSSTHSGNPLCAAAALANLEVIETEGLVEASAKTGALVLERLQTLQTDFPDHFLSIHGRGLFISAHFKRPEDSQPDAAFADALACEAVRRGVLMFTTGRGFIKFVPPLCIDREAALEAVDVIRECFCALLE